MAVDYKIDINPGTIGIAVVLGAIALGYLQKQNQDNQGGPVDSSTGAADKPATGFWQFWADLWSNFGVKMWEVPEDKF